jgi:YegS/Rv2252/BmrU family lipid kinase
LKPEFIATLEPQHGCELARDAVGRGADLVIALGGDGSINEVANGLVGTNVPLGVLPGGTANVLSRELGLGVSIERAAERLGKCVERRVATGCLRDAEGGTRHFLLMGGAGLDARIVYRVSGGVKARAGRLAYWLTGLSQVVKTVDNFEICMNGSAHHCGFLLASRVRNYGGELKIASGASLLKPDFEVVWFEGSNPLRYAWYMLGVLAGRVQRMRGVHSQRADRVEFRGNVHAHIDGEYVGRAPRVLEIVPDSITLLVPESYG